MPAALCNVKYCVHVRRQRLLFAGGKKIVVILKTRNEQSAPVGALLMLAFTSGISCGLSAVDTQHGQ